MLLVHLQIRRHVSVLSNAHHMKTENDDKRCAFCIAEMTIIEIVTMTLAGDHIQDCVGQGLESDGHHQQYKFC